MTNDLDQQSSRTHKNILDALTKDNIQSTSELNEKLLMIMNKNSGLAPYSHEFNKNSIDPQVISGFISAMTSFMGFITGEQQSSWKTVYGSDSVILVETGEWTVGVLAVSRETTEVRSILGKVVAEFEDCFTVLKDSDTFEGSAFGEFDRLTRNLFVDNRVTSRTLVQKRPEWRTLLSTFDLPSTAFAVSKILLGFKEVHPVQEIAEFQSLQIEEVIEYVSEAFWKNIVYLKFVPADDDILILSEGASTVLFQKTNPMHLANESLKVIAQFDGRTQLSLLMKNMNHIHMKVILEDLSRLINRGFIERISDECRLVLLNECILSVLSSKGSLIVGRKNMKLLFDIISENGHKHHPWINRVMLTNQMQSHCMFEGSSDLTVLNDIINTLGFFIEELKQHLSKICGRRVVDRFLHSIQTNCKESWLPYQKKNTGI